jgi:hypothetical protein
MLKITFTEYVNSPTGVDEVEHELPARWAICDHCEGNGKCDNPAFSNGITSSEWEDDWDDYSREMYFSGAYDVSCHICHGSGKVLEVDRDRADEKLLAMYDAIQEEIRIDRMISESERRMGA